MNKKGFTLIELLAVIVILAIIALISVPLITGVIEKTKVGAAKSSAVGYIRAVESQVVINTVDMSKEDISDGTLEVSELETKGVKVNGNGPEMGTVTLEKGEVIACSLLIGDYTVTCLGNGEYDVTKGNNLSSIKLGNLVRNMLNENTTYGNYTFMNGSYFRGVQENNYVSFGGYTWRIMGLNEDGTVRMIATEILTKLPYGTCERNSSYERTEGYIHYWLNNDFLSSLNDSNNIVKETEWCINDTDKEGIYDDSSAELARDNCDGGELFSAKVGLITLDEYNLSGAYQNANYYLSSYNDEIWTLTSAKSYGYAWRLHKSFMPYSFDNDYEMGVVPVINIDPNIVVEKTEGTKLSPYLIN